MAQKRENLQASLEALPVLDLEADETSDTQGSARTAVGP